MSTFRSGGPLSMRFHTWPAPAGGAVFTNREFGSTSVDQTGANELSVWRFRTATRTGAAGHGNRSDSWNVRCVVRTSGVVSHSPYTDAKPREYTTLLLAASRTSNRYFPRLVTSTSWV